MTKKTWRLISNGRSVYEGARLQPIGAFFVRQHVFLIYAAIYVFTTYGNVIYEIYNYIYIYITNNIYIYM